jgi:type IV secretory pathway VirB6-like protein
MTKRIKRKYWRVVNCAGKIYSYKRARMVHFESLAALPFTQPRLTFQSIFLYMEYGYKPGFCAGNFLLSFSFNSRAIQYRHVYALSADLDNKSHTSRARYNANLTKVCIKE